ncbi:MAG TPA: hypothetical protein VFF12_01960 [Myxococcaceae bacterium]|nr:hypothetical protein [Thermoanaerobaculia bacterium]HZW87818.1 hypothetical protein [Myxococcaceae bacterium]
MARLEAADFAERDTSLVYLAQDISEAEQVESLLTEQGIDFAVSLERYVSGPISLFLSERTGVGFTVLAGQAEFCRALLRPSFRRGVVEDPDSGA